MVTAVLVVRADPQQPTGGGGQTGVRDGPRRPCSQVTGRGETWAVRAPVLLVASGAGADQLTGLVVGSQIRAAARLQAPDSGAEIAAVLRLRGALELTRDPGSRRGGGGTRPGRPAGGGRTIDGPNRGPWSRRSCSATPPGSPRS